MKNKDYISRKEQAVLTQKKIYDTTMLLIRKKSYSKITIREICQSAEISIGTFYLYFQSKDDILLDLYHKMEQEFQPDMPPVGGGAAIQGILHFTGQFLLHLHDSFKKDLLREIYRIPLSSFEASLFSPDSLLCREILALLDHASRQDLLKPDTRTDVLIQNLFIFLQGHIYRWLADDNMDFSCMQENCLTEMQRYLAYYTNI